MTLENIFFKKRYCFIYKDMKLLNLLGYLRKKRYFFEKKKNFWLEKIHLMNNDLSKTFIRENVICASRRKRC